MKTEVAGGAFSCYFKGILNSPVESSGVFCDDFAAKNWSVSMRTKIQ